MTSEPPSAVDRRKVNRLDRTLRTRGTDLLDGYYDGWAVAERERVKLRHADGLAWLMRYWRQVGAASRAIDCGLRMLDLDPLQEVVHREVMRLYLETGRPADAIRQYNSCRSVLAQELGIPPSDETTALYRSIRAGHRSAETGVQERTEAFSAALRELEQLVQAFDEARDRLSKVIPLVRGADGGPAEPGTDVAPPRRDFG